MKQRIECGVSGLQSSVFYILVVVFSLLSFNSANIYGQAAKANTEQATYVKTRNPLQTPESTPFLKEYRKVTIGMSADALRDVLGKPAMDYPDGLLYEISDAETIQIFLDPEKNVTAIAITFIKGKGAPAFAEVFGEGVTPEKRENGSVYRMVRYPDAGYWVAYHAGPADDANVSVTMQKL